MHIHITKSMSVAWMIPFYSKELGIILQSMLTACGFEALPERNVLEVSFVDDLEITELNKANMGCSSPTNVLSFPSSMPDNPTFIDTDFPLLGVLAVAPATILRECLLYDQPEKDHFIRLLAHGIAHLTGLDHSSEMDALCARLEHAAKNHVSS